MQPINQPNRSSMTYWYKSPRGFANEYTIDRKRAMRELPNEGDAATQIFASTDIEGDTTLDRFEVARLLQDGRL